MNQTYFSKKQKQKQHQKTAFERDPLQTVTFIHLKHNGLQRMYGVVQPSPLSNFRTFHHYKKKKARAHLKSLPTLPLAPGNHETTLSL